METKDVITQPTIVKEINTDFEVRSLDTICINESRMEHSWWHSLKYLIAGLLFGILLVKAEVISWFRIQEMFRLQSFHMYGVIGSAVVTGIIAVWLIKKFKSQYCGNQICMKGVWGDSGHGPPGTCSIFLWGTLPYAPKGCFLKILHFFTVSEVQVLCPQDIHFLISPKIIQMICSSGTYLYLLYDFAQFVQGVDV